MIHCGVRKAREAIRSPGRRILADGGDLYAVQGRMGVPLSSSRPGGKTVDFYLSRKRDVNAAKAFLRKAMKDERIPAKITLDAYAASHRAVADLKENGELRRRVRVRTSKYLNNAIEQDHRRVKQRLRSMLGLKSFRTAAVVIGGIELAEKIKKGQFKLGKLGGRTATMPEIWRRHRSL